LALEIKVGSRITHRRGHARMSEQLSNGGELDPGLEQIVGGGVTKGTRVSFWMPRFATGRTSTVKFRSWND
jgi:hypothetical protein